MRLGTNRKIFSLGIAAVPLLSRARSGGASSVPAPLRGLTLRPGASAAPTARRTPLPQAGLRCYSSLQAGAWAAPDVRGARGGGARTPPFLWADAGLHPLGRRYSLQLLSLLLSCARLPGTYSSALVLAKLEKGGGEKKKGLKKMAPAPLRSACFLFLLFSPPLSIGSYQSTGGGEGQRNINAE